jgi:hypothetical protein
MTISYEQVVLGEARSTSTRECSSWTRLISRRDAANDCAEYALPTDRAGNSRWDIAGIDNSPSAFDIGALEYQGTEGVDIIVAQRNCVE